MDDVCVLIKEKISYDDYGRTITENIPREVFCKVSGVTRSEFYAAAAANMNPEITITLSDHMDYEGEKLVEYDGHQYSVIRTYQNSERNGNMIELIVERKVGTMEDWESE